VMYQRGMDLGPWAAENAGVDVIVRCATILGEFDKDGNYEPGPPNFDELDEQTGRLVGFVDGFLYLDDPSSPTSMPLPVLIQAIRELTAELGEPPWLGVMQADGYGAAPRQNDPALVAEIEVDHEGVGRRQAEEQRLEYERERTLINHVVDTQPCYLCGRMVERGKEPYEVLGPDSGRGEEGDLDYIPCDPAWKVICSQHT